MSAAAVQSALSFRWATLSDLPALLKLRLAVDADQERRFGDDRWSTTISEQSVIRGLKSKRVLVARRRSRLVAALRIDTKKPWAIDLKYFTPVPKALYLHDVNVDPGLQRSGIGRALMERATRAARDWPADAIRLDTYDGASGAQSFYKHCGFREVGRAVYRSVPLAYFELLLT
jgi:ribosomal protein S18 acetylase RimI-like enzyme